MTRVHHTCLGLGKSFTFEEWCEYSRDYRPSEPVYQNGVYEWNAFDVCLNPELPIRIETKEVLCIVKVAQFPNGRWGYGYDIKLHNDSYGRGVIYTKNDGYDSNEECIYRCIEFIESKVLQKIQSLELIREASYDIDDDRRKELTPSQQVSCFKAFLKTLLKYKEKFNPNQLLLF